MSQKSLTQAVGRLVEELEDFSSEDRHRIVSATLALLGEAPKVVVPEKDDAKDRDEFGDELPAKARSWLKNYGLTFDQTKQVFHFGEEGPQIIASIPGANRKEQVRNAYILCGIGCLLMFGETKFDDKTARTVCELGGFFDSTNHMKYMKGSEFTGSREKGWVLTAPGMKRGANLVAQLGKE